VGPVFPGEVVVGYVATPLPLPLPPPPPPPDPPDPPDPPGSTQVQVGASVQGNGPSVDVQVVVCPVHDTDAGQEVIVMMFVDVIVELPYDLVGVVSGGEVVLDSDVEREGVVVGTDEDSEDDVGAEEDSEEDEVGTEEDSEEMVGEKLSDVAQGT